MYPSLLCFSGLNIYKLFGVADIKYIPHKDKTSVQIKFQQPLGLPYMKLRLSSESIRNIVSRRDVHINEIFYLVRHGGGGFTESDCYAMPIMRRKRYVRKLSKEIKEENERTEAASKGKKSSNGTSFSMDDLLKGKDIPAFQADYKAPAVKKQQPPASPKR